MSGKYLYFIAAGHMSVDLAGGGLPAVLPFLVTHRGMNYTEIAGLVFAFALLSSVLQPIFGYLADKVSKHWFIGLGIMLSGISFASLGFLQNYWAMIISTSLMGVGAAMFHPEGARFVNLISGERKGSGMATFSVGGNAGFGLGPIISVIALTVFGLPGLGIFALIGLTIGTFMLVNVPKIIKLAGKKISSAQKNISSTGKNDWPAFRRLTVMLCGRSTVFQGIMTFLPLYCIYHLAISAELGSSLLSVYAVVGICMTILGGKLADKFSLVSVIKVCTVFYAPTVFLMIFAPSYALVAILLLPLAFASHASYSPFVILGQTYLAKNIGFASGVTLGLSTGLGGVVAPILGLFADNFGIESAMYLLTLIGLITAVAAFTLPQPATRN